jgi:hypothetical protein
MKVLYARLVLENEQGIPVFESGRTAVEYGDTMQYIFTDENNEGLKAIFDGEGK